MSRGPHVLACSLLLAASAASEARAQQRLADIECTSNEGTWVASIETSAGVSDPYKGCDLDGGDPCPSTEPYGEAQCVYVAGQVGVGTYGGLYMDEENPPRRPWDGCVLALCVPRYSLPCSELESTEDCPIFPEAFGPYECHDDPEDGFRCFDAEIWGCFEPSCVATAYDDVEANTDHVLCNAEVDGYCTDDDEDGASEAEGDCDDEDSTVGPFVAEDCDNAIDDDCDGRVDTSDDECPAGSDGDGDVDADGDGDSGTPDGDAQIGGGHRVSGSGFGSCSCRAGASRPRRPWPGLLLSFLRASPQR